MMDNEKILIGSRAICEHLGISRTTLHRLIKAGLPVKNVNNCLCAHVDRLDEFFRVIVDMKPDQSISKKVSKITKS